MEYYALHIFTELPEQRDLLTGLLENEGFSGFEEQDDRLIAYIAGPDFSLTGKLKSIFASQKVTFEIRIIPDTNWNAIWEKSFSPVQIDDFCGIRASFHPPVAGVSHDLIITPRMTFGTGHHSTTASMVRLMKDMDFKGKSVLDFGTGTGILAILAAKMGAGTIWAADNDPEAVKNAMENTAENKAGAINFVCADRPNPDWGIFDCILVNIQLQVILSALPELAQLLCSKGLLLVSGVLEENYSILARVLEQKGFNLVNLLVNNSWVAGSWQKS